MIGRILFSALGLSLLALAGLSTQLAWTQANSFLAYQEFRLAESDDVRPGLRQSLIQTLQHNVSLPVTTPEDVRDLGTQQLIFGFNREDPFVRDAYLLDARRSLSDGVRLAPGNGHNWYRLAYADLYAFQDAHATALSLEGSAASMPMVASLIKPRCELALIAALDPSVDDSTADICARAWIPHARELIAFAEPLGLLSKLFGAVGTDLPHQYHLYQATRWHAEYREAL